MFLRIYISLSLVLLLSACTTSDPDSLSGAPGTDLEISSASQTYTSAFPAKLNATFAESSVVQLTLSGQADGETWSIVIWTTETSLSDGIVEASISDGPIEIGTANLSLGADPTSMLAATSGSVSLHVQNGKISGTVEAQPSSLSATIEGGLVVSCWIPPDDSSSGNSLEPDAGLATALIEDTELATPKCQFLQSARG